MASKVSVQSQGLRMHQKSVEPLVGLVVCQAEGEITSCYKLNSPEYIKVTFSILPRINFVM